MSTSTTQYVSCTLDSSMNRSRPVQKSNPVPNSLQILVARKLARALFWSQTWLNRHLDHSRTSGRHTDAQLACQYVGLFNFACPPRAITRYSCPTQLDLRFAVQRRRRKANPGNPFRRYGLIECNQNRYRQTRFLVYKREHQVPIRSLYRVGFDVFAPAVQITANNIPAC